MSSLLVHADAEETGFATSDGVRIAWRRYGDGPHTILLLPTWNFVDSRVLRHQVDGLRDRFRVVTYDARGSGDSDHPATGYGFDDHLRDALAVMDATNIPTAPLVAASTGTHVAVLLAIRHPQRVQCMALVAPPMDVPGEPAPSTSPDPNAGADSRDTGDSGEPDWRTEYPAFVRWFISAAFPEPDAQETINDIVEIALGADHAMLIQQADEMDWDEAPRHLAEIRCPALVIHGVADPTLAVGAVTAVAASIPGAKLALLDGLGHRPDISSPDIVNPMLVDFIAASTAAAIDA